MNHSPRTIRQLAVLLVMLAMVVNLQAEPRVWTRADGNTAIAELAAATETHATLELLDKKRHNVRITELSVNDQKFIARWRAQRPASTKGGHFMSMWTLTDEERHSGTRQLKLFIELNGDEKLRIDLPKRNFITGGTDEFKNLKLPIDPLEIRNVRIVVESGEDKWRLSKITFQFGTGNRQSPKLEFRVKRWLSMDKREGDQHKTFMLKGKILLADAPVAP